MKKCYNFKRGLFILISTFAYIVYALNLHATFPAVFELSDLNGTNGFMINGIYQKDFAGFIVNGAGDVNGDGIDDMLITAPGSNAFKGQGYLLFGSNKAWSTTIYLANLNGTNGCIINGINGVGCITGTGDINGDNVDDILIGADKAYILFGSKQEWPRRIDLANFNNSLGFIINLPSNPNYEIGTNYEIGLCKRAGDINGDNIDDILIGAPRANDDVGQSFVIFGSKQQWPLMFNVSNLNGTDGFTINAVESVGGSGEFTSGAGDVNGDSIDDILIGTDLANQVYVVFGSKQQWPATVNIANLNGTNGFTINGFGSNSTEGLRVSNVGDVNGDKIDDILIGAPEANNNVGQSNIVFGRKENWPAMIKLSDLDGTNGFSINGKNGQTNAGYTVSGTGDINKDGINDILIGSRMMTISERGQSYVIFGSKEQWPAAVYVESLNGQNGFIINNAGYSSGAISVGGPGDVNADGINDLMIGVSQMNSETGQSYVLFGCCKETPPVPSNTPFILGLGFGIGGGVLLLAGVGYGIYYGYQVFAYILFVRFCCECVTDTIYHAIPETINREINYHTIR